MKKKQLKYALKRLVNCFYGQYWPKISIAIDKKVWFHGGQVDDTTREAIKYAKKILNEN